MYKLSNPSIFTGKSETVIRLTDGVIIPVDEDNTDYKEYLKWIAEGNTPLPPEGN